MLCLVIGALFVITGSSVFFAMEKILHARFDETLTAKARALIIASEVDDGDLEIDLTIQDFAGFGKNGDDYFEVRRSDGGLMLRSPSLIHEGQAFDRFDRISAPRNDQPIISKGQLSDGRAARFYVQQVYPKDDAKKRFQDTYLIVASPTHALQRELAILGTVLAVAGGAAILLMIPLIRFGLGRGLRPLADLSLELGSIRSRDLHRRLASAALPAELQPIALSLNEWLERLEGSFERERRFSSHAAHELRTPLAEIRSIAELGVRWREEATPESSAEIVAVTHEMEALLDKLSLLARADAGQQPVMLERLHLSDLVSSVLGRYEETANDRGLTVQCRTQEDEIITDPILWNAIGHNLVGNAVVHAPRDTEVRLQFSSRGIWVENFAPDLVASDLPHLFERFWRKDGARSGYGHSGLGLSIARASADLLGARCSAELGLDGQLMVEVTFGT